MINSLDPAKSFTVTSVFVALVRTAAFELVSADLRNSISARRERPAIPNSTRAWSIHVTASARTLGAFCFESGSYADDGNELGASYEGRATYRVRERTVGKSSPQRA